MARTTARGLQRLIKIDPPASIEQRLRNDIVAGALPFGSRLIIEDLATRYGVSHMPIREALRILHGEGLVVIDANNRVVYANEHARELAGRDLVGQRVESVRARLQALGGSSASLRSGGMVLGEAIFLPRSHPPRTLAERERQAIVDTLNGARGRLAETARRLGISRTTLWRRLRAYGIRPQNGNGRVASPTRIERPR